MKNIYGFACLFRLFFAPFIIVILIFSSCHSTGKEKKFLVGFSQCTDGDDWRKMMLEEMKRELSFHNNIQFIYKTAIGNSERQIQQIEELVARHIDLLIISPNEVKPLSPEIQKVYDAGIPVVVVDRRTDSKKYTAFIGASNFEVGQNAGRYAASILKGNGNIMEATGLPDASPVIDRHDGFMDIISHYPGLHYVKKLDDNSRPFPQKEEEALQRLNIDLIYAQNDFMAFDAYKICKKLGIDKKVKIIGIDGLPMPGDGLDMVDNKFISATVLYPTGGQEAILTAANILEHKPFKKENQLFTTIIDSTNVRIMKLQNNKVIEQQKNIDRSQQKMEEQEIITRNQTNIIYAISTSLALALIFGSVLFYYLKENRKINTRLNHQNEEILSQRNQLIELGKKAQEATDAKINFFTNISHEFRTPLTLIIAPLEELIVNSKIHFEAKQNLVLIQKNVIRLLRLINQLIDFRKIESYKMKLQASENDLVLFTNEIAESFKTTAKKRHIDLNVFSKERSIPIWFDTSMLDKVLFNLLSNAFKFTNDSGYIHITLEKNAAANMVKVKVEDNGIGMTKEVAEHAFELFYQGNITSQQGSGLGLALSKELITLHHGKISVTSEPGKGTCFEISLLAGNDHFEKDELLHEEPSKVMYQDERFYAIETKNELIGTEAMAESTVKKEQSILVIEDNADLRNFIVDSLGRNYEILAAENGNLAVQMAFENIPDLIISDVVLPGKDGISITNLLKNDFRTSHIPIILLTAKNAIEERIQGMKSMADAYIVKPFNLRYLEETIRSMMKNREILRDHFTSELPLEAKSHNPNKLDRKFINEFTSIIENNISNEKFTVDVLYQTMGISRIQLYRKVKALLGYNINDYILNVRLQKAKHYLNEGELSIAEVAYKVGFTSPAYFSTVFKSKFGVTPSDYREKKK